MRKVSVFIIVLSFLMGLAAAEPVIDGKIAAGEYPQSKAYLGGAMTVYWAWDAAGGLSIGLTKKNSGWIAIGLGSQYMDQAYIFMGYPDGSGKPILVEQQGRGHSHSAVSALKSDRRAFSQSAGLETLEFHLSPGALNAPSKGLPFIVAYSPLASPMAKHEDYDTGSIPIK